MIQLALFLFIGVMLLLSLVFLSLRRSPRTEGSSGALVDARQALNSLQAGLLPADLVHRIFAKDDLEYVRSEAPVHVQQMFYRERKIIALAWVGQMRSQIRRLMRFHLGSARFYAELSMKTEMALAIDCGVVLCECRLLQALLYFCGPIRHRGLSTKRPTQRAAYAGYRKTLFLF